MNKITDSTSEELEGEQKQNISTQKIKQELDKILNKPETRMEVDTQDDFDNYDKNEYQNDYLDDNNKSQYCEGDPDSHSENVI